MKKLKLNLDLTKKIFNDINNELEFKECYNNTFKVASYFISSCHDFKLSDFYIAYGFIKKDIGEDPAEIFFRHAFLIYKKDNSVIDVTACFWEELEEEYATYDYYVFKKYNDIDKYTDDIIANNYLPGMMITLLDEEIKAYNKLIKKGLAYNTVDLMDLITRYYGGNIFDGIKEYNEGKSVIEKI